MDKELSCLTAAFSLPGIVLTCFSDSGTSPSCLSQLTHGRSPSWLSPFPMLLPRFPLELPEGITQIKDSHRVPSQAQSLCPEPSGT